LFDACLSVLERSGGMVFLLRSFVRGPLESYVERASSMSQPTSLMKIRYSSRSATVEDHARGLKVPHRPRPQACPDFWNPTGNHHRRALALFREIGDCSGEAEALNGLGDALHATGQSNQARAQHAAALTAAIRVDDRYEQARAHDGLAHIHHATAERDHARRHGQHALRLYTDLSVPEADHVRAQLTALQP
jgi:tetratricopeptide (TPR) repeat protein